MRHNLGASYDQHTSYLAVAGAVRIRGGGGGAQSIMHVWGGMVSRHGPVPGTVADPQDECEGVAGIKTGPHLINECAQLQAWFRSKIETGETGLNVRATSSLFCQRQGILLKI